ncbi:MAG TPA: histidine triad nucleotide-binding protein [Gammaproteobacteria bacterium]|jgi:histidine triad (HIT) family protein
MSSAPASDCLFCKIIAGQLPSTTLHEDDRVVAFKDVHPQAPFHALIVPRKHIATLDDFAADDAGLVGHLLLTAKHLAAEQRLPGYRVAMNVQRAGGQVIFHVHLHVLGGRPLKAQLG